MINLLPPNAKKRVTKEYWLRVCTVWALLFSFSLACASFVFLPVYVLISSQVAAYTESANTASEKIATYENVTAGLIRASQEAKQVIETTAIVPVSDYIAIIDAVQGSAIELTNISMTRSTDGMSPIQISGIADDRQSLAAFRDRLLAEPEFISVDLPIANLAKDRDVPFSLTVAVASSSTP